MRVRTAYLRFRRIFSWHLHLISRTISSCQHLPCALRFHHRHVPRVAYCLALEARGCPYVTRRLPCARILSPLCTDVQNSSLAGGVVMGVAAHLPFNPATAVVRTAPNPSHTTSK